VLWKRHLPATAPKDRTTVGDLLQVDGGSATVTVDQLVYMSYLLDVSPPVVLRRAHDVDPWPMVPSDPTAPGKSRRRPDRKHMDDWLWGYRELPGQDKSFYQMHQPLRLWIPSSEVEGAEQARRSGRLDHGVSTLRLGLDLLISEFRLASETGDTARQVVAAQRLTVGLRSYVDQIRN